MARTEVSTDSGLGSLAGSLSDQELMTEEGWVSPSGTLLNPNPASSLSVLCCCGTQQVRPAQPQLQPRQQRGVY